MSEIYGFQSVVIAFVERTPWIEAAFPFGTSGFPCKDERLNPVPRSDA